MADSHLAASNLSAKLCLNLIYFAKVEEQFTVSKAHRR